MNHPSLASLAADSVKLSGRESVPMHGLQAGEITTVSGRYKVGDGPIQFALFRCEKCNRGLAEIAKDTVGTIRKKCDRCGEINTITLG